MGRVSRLRHWLGAVILLLLALGVAAQEETPRRLLLTALKPTEGLTAADLEVRIGNKPAEVLRVSQAEERPLRLLVIVSDVPGPRLVQNLGEVRRFLLSLPEGSTVQVNYAQGGAMKVEQPFTRDLAAAAAALRLPAGAIPPQDLGLLVSEALAQFPQGANERAQIVYFGEGTEPELGDLYGDARLNRARRRSAP